ncbi:hypothetical protein OCGS_2071 [Oceaniovalibus guishaninsula JLT2003]|uniref:Cytochrome c oxidase subunit IV bacterial aa3 type domain-containing protein n=1 Tax=Oceaniovalibus guishaninsula JLT2003 TaxID=1231392 RepID=K2HAP6_9RHOB|nr:aa3-type cytochrome c oxidase subunit IV [Oceaniovalibus guishaninsula]EKE43737.1 hypothetical protein OCGS_2071 [Oceaniovalibus guishaninsula JLT2003]
MDSESRGNLERITDLEEHERTFAGFIWWVSRVTVAIIVILILIALING